MERCLWKCHNPRMLSLPFTFPSSEVAHSPSSMAALSVCVPDPHFLFHSLCPRTSCLLPLLNMGQIRETSACLFFKREVLSGEHSHSILPVSFCGGWVGGRVTLKRKNDHLAQHSGGLLEFASPSEVTLSAPRLENCVDVNLP